MAHDMTPRKRFIAALERRPLAGRVPHFELEFYLHMEAFGQISTHYRNFSQWDQMEEKEREHITEVLELTGWRVRGERGAAEMLGIKPTTLEARMKKLNIKRQR